MSRLYPSQPIVGVGAVIVHGGRVLVARRANPPAQGEWSIPGGGLELGERLAQGVAREVLEETGLQVEVGPVLDVIDSIFPDEQGSTAYHYVLVDYVCRVQGGVAAAASDCAELRWVLPAELDGLGLRPVTLRMIRLGLLKASECWGEGATAAG
jgi:ADP-ribose pyrophosphatase YjhB (NUDIX family)